MMTSRRRNTFVHPSPSSAPSPFVYNGDSRQGNEHYENDEKSSSVSRRLSLSSLMVLATTRYNNSVFVMLFMAILTHVAVGAAVYWWTIHHAAHGDGGICPSNIVDYMDWSSNSGNYRHNEFLPPRIPPVDTSLASLERIRPSTPPKQFTPVPAQLRKTFYYDGTKNSHPIARAYRSRGWRQVDQMHAAHWIYTYNHGAPIAKKLSKWQRFNFLPGFMKWNSKYEFAYYYNQYERTTGKRSPYVPETYMLSKNEEDVKAFQTVLEQQGGKNHPWVLKEATVNQGKVC
jgi:hypothetical protein